MHILMVTMSLGIGGAETHILELARCLTRCGHSVTVVSNGGVYVDALTADGVRHVDAPLHSKHPAALLRAYRTLRRLVREERFDVIHAHARIPGGSSPDPRVSVKNIIISEKCENARSAYS